jgi:hypothetical protein
LSLRVRVNSLQHWLYLLLVCLVLQRSPFSSFTDKQPTPTPAPAPAESVDDDPGEDEEENVIA